MNRRRRRRPYANIGASIGGAGDAASHVGGGGKNHGGGNHATFAQAGSAIGAAGGSAKGLGRGFKHAHNERERHAIRAVSNYAAGTKGYKPTLEQFNLAWPKLTPDVKDVLGPAILKRAATEDFDPEFGVTGDKNGPKPLPGFLRKYNPKAFDAYMRAIPGSAAVQARQAKTDEAFNDDLGRAIEFGLLVAPVGKVVESGLRGYKAIQAARAGRAAQIASEAPTAVKAARGATAAGRTAKVGATAAKASKGTRLGAEISEQAAKRGARTRALRETATTSLKGSRPVRAARVASQTKAGRTGLYLGKRPIRTTAAASALAQTPAAIQHGDPGELVKPFTEGAGVVPDLLKSARTPLEHLGIVGNAVADAFELPAVAIPSVYLLGKAGVEAVKGDSTNLKAQWGSYKEQGFLPAALSGDFGEALKRFEAHPVYSALEVSGAKAAVGRGAGAAMRSGALGSRAKAAASTERAPLELGGDQTPLQRAPYSKDVIRQHWPRVGQKARDRRRVHTEDGKPIATSAEVDRALKERSDSIAHGNEIKRRQERAMQTDEAIAARPAGKIDADAVRLVLMGKIRSTRTFQVDIQRLAAELDAAYARLKKAANDRANPSRAGAARVKIEANRDLRGLLDEIAKHGNPEAIFEAARRNAGSMRELDAELVRVGLLDENQARVARVAVAGRTHLGVTHDKPLERVRARERYRERKAELKRTKRAQGQREKALAKTRADAARSKGRLERLEAQRNLAVRMKKVTARSIDRNPSSLLNRERARLLNLEGKKLEHEAALRSIKARRKELKASLREKPKKPREQFVDSEGRPISAQAMEEGFAQMGGDPENLGFVTLRPHQTARQAGYVPSNERPRLPSGALTGKAADQGAFDPSYESIVNQRRISQGRVSAADAFDFDIRDGQVAPEIVSRARTGREALDMATNPEAYGIEAPVGQGLRVIRRYPFMAKRGERKAAAELQVREEASADRGFEARGPEEFHGAWEEANIIGPDTPGPFALIPETKWIRMRDHYRDSGAGTKAVQQANQVFKKTVLVTKPKWIAGNAVDINLRAMFDGEVPFGLGLRKRGVARAVDQRAMEIDPIAALRNRGIIGHGTHYTSVEEMNLYRTAKQDLGNGAYGRSIKMLANARNAPGIRELVNGWNRFARGVFKANEKFIENPVVEQLYGRELLNELSAWERTQFRLGRTLTQEVIDRLAMGQLDTAHAIKVAKQIEQTTGQWGRNSPTARFLITTYAPFGMWTRAALKYVFVTLPVNHPIKTAIIANIEQMTLEERKALGLSAFSDRPAPANLRGSIPTGDGGLMPVGTLSSFGYASDLPENVAGSVFPQGRGVLNAAVGLNPFGDKLEHEDGTPFSEEQRLIAGAAQFAGITVPGFSQVTQITGWDAAGIAGADSFAEGLAKQFPFTDASGLEPGVVEWLRNKETYPTYEVQGSSGSSSSSSSSSGTSLPPWYGSGSSGGGVGTSLPPWYGN